MNNVFAQNKDQIISFSHGKIQVPDQPVIPFIEGDGCGPEIWRATQQVVDAAVDLAYLDKRAITWIEVLAGEKAFRIKDTWLPDETIEAFKKFHIGIKGPLNTPVGDGIRSLNVALRKELDLYACMRPVKYFTGTPSPLRRPERVDIVLFRENTEDVYTGIEFEEGTSENTMLLDFMKAKMPAFHKKIRFPNSTSLGIKPVSREGTERIVRAAIRWALYNHRKVVTLVHKGNIMKYTEGGFMKWGYELAEKEFGDQVYTMSMWKNTQVRSSEQEANQELLDAQTNGKLIIKDMIADATFERMITYPQEMDVLVSTNLNGDYISDALAALVGGLGIAPGANINFETGDAIFEATHGTAPILAGQNKANPCSLILSAVMMLRYIGWHEAANLAENGLRKTLICRNVTIDFFDQMKTATLLSTSDFAEQVVQRM
jgi:isocitrate dehydrogenase